MKLELIESETGQGVTVELESADVIGNVPLLHNLMEKLKLARELPTRGLAFTETEYGLMMNLALRRMIEVAKELGFVRTGATADDQGVSNEAIQAGVDAFKETTAFWPPECLSSRDHLTKLVENIVEAVGRFEAR